MRYHWGTGSRRDTAREILAAVAALGSLVSVRAPIECGPTDGVLPASSVLGECPDG